MDGDLQVASSTDVQAVVNAAAQGDEKGARTEAPKFEVERLDGSTTASYEHPRSDRKMLWERIQQHDADLEALNGENGQRIQTNEQTDEGREAEAEAENLADEGEKAAREAGIDMEAVRRAATEDAIAEARRRFGGQQGQQLTPEQVQLIQTQARVAGAFQARLSQIMDPSEFQELIAKANEDVQSGKSPDIRPAVTDALMAAPGGAEATAYLLRNPEERDRIASLPDHLAVFEIGQLSERLASSRRSQLSRSNAPGPFKRVGGSSARVHQSMDTMDYREYQRVREKQERNRYGVKR